MVLCLSIIGGLNLIIDKHTVTSDYLALTAFFSLIFISGFSTYFEPLKYAKYLILPLLVILVAAFKSKKMQVLIVKDKIVIPFVFLVLYGCFSSVFIYDVEGVKDLYFIATYSLPFVFFDFQVKRSYVNGVFVLFVGQFFLKLITNAGGGAFSLLDSKGILESTDCFIFGFFAIYYASISELKKSLFCFVLIFISLKRIVLLGCLASLLVLFLDRKIFNVNRPIILFGFASFCTVITVCFGAGVFDQLIFDVFGVSPNYLTMGRSNIFGSVVDDFLTGKGLVFGNGLGTVYPKVEMASNGLNHNLHSDLLKVLYEYGLVGFILLFSFLSRLPENVNVGFFVILIASFMTDNILIYSHVMFFYLFLGRALQNDGQ